MLIAHYPLNGNADDALGRYDGTASNVTWVDGKLGQAGSFNGTSTSNVIIQNDIDLLPSYSVSAWFKAPVVPTGERAIFGKDLFFILRLHTNSTINVHTRTPANTWQHAGFGVIPIGEWVHVTITYSANTLKGYINGDLVATYTRETKDTAQGNMRIGQRDATDFFLGEIDDVRIYDHALSKREIRDLYQGLLTSHNLRKDSNDSTTGIKATVINTTFTDDGALFTGTDSYLDLGADSRFLSRGDNAPITVACTVKPTSFTTRDMILSANPRGSTGYTYMFGLISGVMNVYTGSAWRATGSAIPLNEESHLVWTFDGVTLRGYINGVLVGTRTDFSYTVKVNNTVKVGGYTSTADFNGYVADHKVFAEALSADEVKELYQQRASLDSQGNFYAHMIKEHNEFSFQKTPTGAGHDGSYGLYFSVDKNVVISSSLVRPYFSGNVTFKLYDFDSKVLIYETQEIPVINGIIQRIQLDIPCKVGVNYWLSPEAGYGNWMRTDAGNTFEGTEDVFTFQRSRNLAGDTAGRWYYLFDIYYSVGLSIEKSKTRQKVSEVGITNGLVAYYPLRTSTKDLSGNGYDGVATGAIPVGGGFDGRGAYRFDGVNDYVIVDEQIVDSPIGLTVSGWIKPETGGSNYRCALHCGEGTSVGATRYWFGISAANLLTITIGANLVGWAAGETNITVTYGEYVHLAAAWDGNTVQVFVDGVIVKSYQLSSYSNTTAPTRLGASSNGSNYQYSGDISNVKIFNRALSPEEIAVEYKRTGVTKMTQHQGITYIQGEFKEV